MVTFHPSGFTHGPHPRALQGIFKSPKPATDEYAVMLDARDALEIGDLPESLEERDYVESWKGRRSEEHTSELQSLMRISYAVFCLKTKNTRHNPQQHNTQTK